jgi:hypothetical protein
VGEEVGLEWLEAVNEQHAVVVFPKFVAPELVIEKKSRVGTRQNETNARLQAYMRLFRRLLTLASFLNALMMGSV